jgi:hypothetical protein
MASSERIVECAAAVTANRFRQVSDLTFFLFFLSERVLWPWRKSIESTRDIADLVAFNKTLRQGKRSIT